MDEVFYNVYMFSNPSSLVAQLEIMPGSSVADLGTGVGAYALLLSKKVGPTGKVYACDVQKDTLTRLENEIHALGIKNIQTVHSNIENSLGTKLRDSSIDWVVVANVLFQIEDKHGFIQEVYRIMKPGGRVVVIDWSESFGNMGPHVKDVINEQEAEQKFTEQGFRKLPQVLSAGAHHYGIIFTK